MNQSNKPLDPSKRARVEIADWDDFQEFDVVVQMPGIDGGPFVVERDQPAPEPEPAYEPGDMAAVTARGWINGWSVRTQTNDGWASHSDSDDVRSDAEVESIVPLVVINPATVDWRGLQSQMSVLVVGVEPFKRAGDILGVVRRELGIEGS